MRVFTLVVFAALSGCMCGSGLSAVSSDLVADPSSIDFGTLAPSATATRSVLIRNSRRALVRVNNETMGGVDVAQFAISSPPIGQLRGGEDAVVSVTFTAPATPNTLARAELILETDAVNPRLVVLVFGSSSETVDAGQSVPDAGCRPRTCRDANAECGMVSDGCGAQLRCGECTLPAVCGGQPLRCAPIPPSPCALRMPPAVGIPCEISTPGTQYYVSSTTGDDSNDGLSPSTAWKTLAQALDVATSGSTVRVAAGRYTEDDLVMDRPLTLKGGYDTLFTTWNPDAHHSIITGRPLLENNDAVMGGFRIIRQRWPSQGAVSVSAGKLIRNYIELFIDALPDFRSYGITAISGEDGRIVLACNDVYGHNEPVPGDGQVFELIQVGHQAGHTVLESNRMCLDSFPGSHDSAVISGYGSCSPDKAGNLTITNNILEGRAANTYGIEIFPCEQTLEVVATNNTVLSTAPALNGFDTANIGGAEAAAPVQWRLTNNVFVGLTNDRPFDVHGPDGGLLSVEGNLIFGFRPNEPSSVPPLIVSNDFTGAPSLASTFVDWEHGDFRPRPMGPAASGGINVHGLQQYGRVVGDLGQRVRPDAGQWARGALLP